MRSSGGRSPRNFTATGLLQAKEPLRSANHSPGEVLTAHIHKRLRLLALSLLALSMAAGGVGGSAWAASAAGGTEAPAGGSAAPSPASSGGSTGGAQSGSRTHNLAGSGGSATARASAVKITAAGCVPAAHCARNHHQVSQGGELLLRGTSLRRGMVVAFPHSRFARIARNSPSARLSQTSIGLVVRVPKAAHSGRIMVLLGGGKHSNSYGPIQVFNHALHPPAPPQPRYSAPVTAAPSGTAFDGQGMWIWYVSKSDGGSLAAIAKQAHEAGVSTLFVKSSDGSSNWWSQFSPELVSFMHANGLHVCAWQYVYGTNPSGEATLGAKAVETGADCLAIDAESEYENKYGAAQAYIADLRAKVGEAYPLGLASFPYVYYHTALPYSVFLGPNGAQFNAPQMYWKAIGNSVDTVYANTFISNRIYGRPIMPLGQTYESPSAADLVRFREEAPLYGASGISWWDFQETSGSGWRALAEPLQALSSVTPDASWSELSEGKKGDPVLWMQEHLATAIPAQATTGIFDSATKANLEQFQAAHGIPVSGHTEAATWQALLAIPPVAVDWTEKGPKG